jgi:hypothetical protein
MPYVVDFCPLPKILANGQQYSGSLLALLPTRKRRSITSDVYVLLRKIAAYHEIPLFRFQMSIDPYVPEFRIFIAILVKLLFCGLECHCSMFEDTTIN